jgi:OOP family OmpA-OmpF porin
MKYQKIPAIFFLFATWILTASIAHAELSDHFGFTLGGAYEYGQLGDNGMGLQKRSMGAESLEFLPGYKLGSKWLIGPDFEYRFQQQLSKLSDSGGTNLAGRGYLVGVGAKYRFSERWSFQGAIDFLGDYNFDHQTDQAQDDHLGSPISLNLKGQYFFNETLPVSVDGIIDYQNWSNFHVSGSNNRQAANQWMVGVGLTYHFGDSKNPTPEPIQEKPKTDVPNAPEQKDETPQKTSLEGTAFAPNSFILTKAAQEKMRTLGAELAKRPGTKIIVRGYTDTSGNAQKNKTLSLDRANSVKTALVEGGFPSEDVETEGFGSLNPISDNGTKEGRAANRRVEIEIKSWRKKYE